MNEKNKSLTFSRVLTKAGTPPHSTVEWSTRAAVITDDKGKKIFEKNDVEAPESWSALATNIVASKYFRTHENSMKQILDRVVGTIIDWGRASGHLATEHDAETFGDELTHILLHQMASFNSPVWFNLGVEDHPQVSACFINSVEDDMGSILGLAAIEADLFKGGSGSGTNFSTLRSSKERLSSGGKASGPVSFMRGFDAFAGVIKSGGKTRRAAKMVILNVDHPDIQQFIDCKVTEEKKAWALIEAGYNGDINGEAYGSVFFQNSNNSVRVTDEFMKAAVDNRNFETKAVLDGSPVETLKAADLLRGIAQATHMCGDPGLQFDDVINEWHTCKASGRINSSNPCFTGDMRLLTIDGYISFENLARKRAALIINHQGEVSESKIWSTGVKDIVKIKFSPALKKEITCTPDHVFMLNDGSSKQAQHLSRGDRLMPYVSMKTKFDFDLFLAGFVQGDGSTKRLTSKLHKGVEVFICAKDSDIAEMYGWTGNSSRGNCVYSNYAYNIAKKYNLVPAPLFDRPLPRLLVKERADFLSGLFSANGCVVNKTRVALKTTCKELVCDLVDWLGELDIQSYVTINQPKKVKFANGTYECRKSYDVNIHRYVSILKFAEKISFKQKYKVKALKELLVHRAPCVQSVTPAGREIVYDFSEPLTHWGVVENFVVHNCSEYMFLDDSACNLASLNLMRFVDAEGNFDTDLFRHVIDVMITAQEILIDNAKYPTEKIANNSYNYRPVGLGYANLGALLMSLGLPYDSPAGRAYAASITALMTGEAYAQSARIADKMKPFLEYPENAEAMLDVIGHHMEALDTINPSSLSVNVMQAARAAWDEAQRLGKENGFRNAQVTALAPTGTISFIMDCDTTGIEPDIALVKYKKLVGGGTLKIVNNMVGQALERLGYDVDERKIISDHVEKTGAIEGAPGLLAEHSPVFDCALKTAGGTRVIGPMGHLRMMSAVQPFISGAISKTVNVPNSATVDDVYNIFIKSWRLGLKAVAIYRDGSKRTQPLSTSEEIEKTKEECVNLDKTPRRRLPDERKSLTHKFDISGHSGYLTAGLYENNDVGEIFVRIAKEGSTISGLIDAFSIAVSLALQYGVPLSVLVEKFKSMRFEPAGFTRNPEIQIAKSITDYIFRWLELKFLHQPPAVLENSDQNFEEDFAAPLCSGCGSLTIRSGSCHCCQNCGSTSGCS